METNATFIKERNMNIFLSSGKYIVVTVQASAMNKNIAV